MADYQAVQKALADGADPSMLCATCPWDRYCVTPPAMTSSEIDQRVAEASEQDKRKADEARAAGQEAPMPAGTLMTAMLYAGKDTMGQFCPVLALRLRSSGGRKLADSVKSVMQDWRDDA